MTPSELAAGQHASWTLIKKLGEGDAGEVYQVESILEKKAAILKRPHRSAFSSDIIRQATQIEAEGKILQALNGLGLSEHGIDINTPRWLDQSKTGSEFSERFFIVIEKAPGLDLNTLARAVHFGQYDSSSLDAEEQRWAAALVQAGRVPDLLMLRALSGVILLLDKIHIFTASAAQADKSGLIWNDVKPDHIFWDPRKKCLTIIDWGNGQFLEADGATKDRRYSQVDDSLQFVQAVGKFLANASPELYRRLDWPANLAQPAVYPEAVQALRQRIAALLEKETEQINRVRQRESDLLQAALPGVEALSTLQTIQQAVIACGELPNYAAVEQALVRTAVELAGAGQLEDVHRLCSQVSQLSGSEASKWRLAKALAETARGEIPAHARYFRGAIAAALGEDWPAALWELLPAAAGESPPYWWEDLSRQVNQAALQTSADIQPPLVAARRLAYALESAYQKLGDTRSRRALAHQPADTSSINLQLQIYRRVLRALKEEVLPRWWQVEPDPPDAGIEYADLERLLEDINTLAPALSPALLKSLDQPRAQVKIIMDAWQRKEFEIARKGLRRLLLWDPDRRRVLAADRALRAAPTWLEKVHLGPKKGEPLAGFVARLELQGRDLRNQIGPTRWLDLILAAFARLRKGSKPSELLAEHPELMNEVFWLEEYEPRQAIPGSRSKDLKLEREPEAQQPEPLLHGSKESGLGQNEDMLLTDPLDTWAPEAIGSSARVYVGFLRNGSTSLRQCAVKVMRGDRKDYALPLFREETRVLSMLKDVPGVTRLLEAGYILPEAGTALPSDDRREALHGLRGKVLRFGPDDMAGFLRALDTYPEQGWLPYLATEKRSREDNLMLWCDAGYTRGKLLPLPESLRLAIQICDILQAAHVRNVIYRDHKILHFYWLDVYNGVFAIDWNVARFYAQGLTRVERQFDLVQFSARALHHILTGRPAPGALPLGPTRPEEIEAAAPRYRVQWTYDDQRLPNRLKDIVEQALAGEYSQALKLRDDLHQVYLQLPEIG